MAQNKELNPIEIDDQAVDQDKHQIVYMMPHQEFKDDEIDLFQLLLPPLKYKVQILIFLIIGILFGIGILWYKTTIESVTESEEKYLSYQTEIKNLREKKQFMIEDFYASINRIKGGNSVLQIVGAQYRFSVKEKPEEVKTIDIDSYQSMADLGEDALSDSQKDFDIILRIKSAKIDRLKQELKEAYDSYFVLNEKLEDLEYQEKSNLTHTYVLVAEKQNDPLNGEQKRDSLGQQIAELRKNLLKIEDQKQEVLIELTDFNHKINYIQKTLSENINFKTTQTEIPWRIWNDIKAQTENGAKKQQEDIKNIARKISEFDKEITKFSVMAYIFKNDSKIPLGAFDWPALKALGEAKVEKAKIYPMMGVGKSKILITSFIIALFIGIVSVYIRVFLKKTGEKEEFKSQKQEFTEALKSWKL